MTIYQNDFLIEYIEHIAYEMTGLIVSYIRLVNIGKYGEYHPLGIQGEKNDCLDLMTLHFRNLYEFFCFPSKKGYVRAVDYCSQFQAKTNDWFNQKANNQVSHLTVKRHELAKDFSTKSWNSNEVMKWLIINLQD